MFDNNTAAAPIASTSRTNSRRSVRFLDIITDPTKLEQAYLIQSLNRESFLPEEVSDVTCHLTDEELSKHYLSCYMRARTAVCKYNYLERAWLPVYGPNFIALIKVLRQACYYNPTTGEIRDTSSKYSLEWIAHSLGVSQRTLKRWLSPKAPWAKDFSRFVVVVPRRRYDPVYQKGVTATNGYVVALHEPLLATDLVKVRIKALALFKDELKAMNKTLPDFFSPTVDTHDVPKGEHPQCSDIVTQEVSSTPLEASTPMVVNRFREPTLEEFPADVPSWPSGHCESELPTPEFHIVQRTTRPIAFQTIGKRQRTLLQRVRKEVQKRERQAQRPLEQQERAAQETLDPIVTTIRERIKEQATNRIGVLDRSLGGITIDYLRRLGDSDPAKWRWAVYKPLVQARVTAEQGAEIMYLARDLVVKHSQRHTDRQIRNKAAYFVCVVTDVVKSLQLNGWDIEGLRAQRGV